MPSRHINDFSLKAKKKRIEVGGQTCHARRPSWHAGRLRALPLVVVVCPGCVVFLLFLPKLLDDFLHVVCLLGHSVELSFLALVEFTVVLLHIAKLRI